MVATTIHLVLVMYRVTNHRMKIKTHHSSNDHTSGLGDGSSHCKTSREEPGNRSRDGITWLGMLRLKYLKYFEYLWYIFKVGLEYLHFRYCSKPEWMQSTWLCQWRRQHSHKWCGTDLVVVISFLNIRHSFQVRVVFVISFWSIFKCFYSDRAISPVELHKASHLHHPVISAITNVYFLAWDQNLYISYIIDIKCVHLYFKLKLRWTP